MASPKKQIKINKQSEKISKMREEILKEIKKDEMSERSRQSKKRDESPSVDEIKIKQPDQENKTFDVLKNSAEQKEVSAPKPIENNEPAVSMPIKTKAKAKKVSKKKKKKTKKINIFALFAFGTLLGLLLFAAVIFYVPRSENLLARKISEAVPCPAIIINKKFISYNDYLKEVDAVDIFLARQQRAGIIRELPPRKQIREEIANLLIKQEIIKNLADQYEITASQKEIDDEINKIKDQSRSEESFDGALKDLYGWSEEDFGNKVIRNYLLVSKLSAKFFPDVSADELKGLFDKKIEEIKKEMNIYVLVK
ncbi:MAG: SurA N-terminal domain-containing protein [bacterium]